MSVAQAPNMLGRFSPELVELLRDLAALAISTVLFPFLFIVALLSSTYSTLSSFRSTRISSSTRKTGKSQRFLLSGAGSSHALTFARLLQSQGHTVIGIDYEGFPLLSPARFSNAYRHFYQFSHPRRQDRKAVSKDVRFGLFGSLIHPPVQTSVKGPSKEELYAADILAVMQHEHIDLWIPCETPCKSGPVTYRSFLRTRTALEDAGFRSICPSDDASALSRSPLAFADFINNLHLPVRAPQTSLVHSRDDVHRAISDAAPSMSFTLDRINRAVEVQRTPTNSNLLFTPTSPSPTSPQSPRSNFWDTPTTSVTLTPSKRERNSVYNAVSKLPVTESTPWLLREHIPGPHLTASFLVANGHIRAFVAAETHRRTEWHGLTQTSLTGSVQPLPSTHYLYPALLSFAKTFASYQSGGPAVHLSIEYAAQTMSIESGAGTDVVALSCGIGLHSTMSLLMTDASARAALVDVYANLAAVPVVPKRDRDCEKREKMVNGIMTDPIVVPSAEGVRGVHNGLSTLTGAVIAVLLRFVAGLGTAAEAVEVFLDVVRLATTWEDVSFDVADPWPWWFETSVREPGLVVWKMTRRVFAKYRRRDSLQERRGSRSMSVSS